MSKQIEAWLATELERALQPSYLSRARLIAAALSPVLLRLGEGWQGAQALHACLANVEADSGVLAALAGKSFAVADLTITFQSRAVGYTIAFENLATGNASAILLKQLIPPRVGTLDWLHKSGHYRTAVGLALGVALSAILMGVPQLLPAANRQTFAPADAIERSQPGSGFAHTPTAAPPAPTAAPPAPTAAPPAPTAGGTLADSYDLAPPNPAPPPDLLLAPGNVKESFGWAVVFGGAEYTRTLGLGLGDPAIRQELLIVAVEVINRSGQEQPFPTATLGLSSPTGPLQPNVELSERYLFYDSAGNLPGGAPVGGARQRRLGIDAVPLDEQRYLIFLAFDVAPEWTNLVLYYPGDRSAGWLVR